MDDVFFPESEEVLSSIEHSAAAPGVDPYGYQTGPNPYEQAKRQYNLEKAMEAEQNNSNQQSQVDHLKVE